MDINRITAVAPGWVELSSSTPARSVAEPRVLVQYERRDDGRVAIATLILTGGALSAAALRSISPARIEARLNRHGGIGSSGSPPTAEQLADFAERKILFPAQFEQIDAALASYLDEAPKTPKSSKSSSTKRSTRRPLPRPDGSDPEAFYRRVADAYNEVVSDTNAPAPLLAEESGVPVATVRGWIAEARRRGFLPAARRGRAG
jgi:hypothetical protein